VLGFAHFQQSRPLIAAESRSLSFWARFWLGPFIASLTVTTVSAYGRVQTLHRSSRRDFNPLDTCAAGRTKIRLRGLDARLVVMLTKYRRWKIK
jgi:hypothetical protein